EQQLEEVPGLDGFRLNRHAAADFARMRREAAGDGVTLAPAQEEPSYFYRSPEQSAAHARALGNPNAVASFSAHSLGLAIDLQMRDRKSTRLNSSHVKISYAVFCLKKKKKKH